MSHDSPNPEQTPADFSDENTFPQEAAEETGVEEPRSGESGASEGSEVKDNESPDLLDQDTSQKALATPEPEFQAPEIQSEIQETVELAASVSDSSSESMPADESVAAEAGPNESVIIDGIEMGSEADSVDEPLAAEPAPDEGESVVVDGMEVQVETADTSSDESVESGVESEITASSKPDQSAPISSEPAAPAPTAPPRESALTTIGNFLAAIAQLIRKTVQAIVPLFRAIAILILRFVLQISQLLLDLLEGTPAVPAVSASEGSTDASTGSAATASSRRRSVFTAVAAVWKGLVHLVRTILPESWNQKLPTPLLNLLLAGVIAFALWLTPSILWSRSPSTAFTPPPSETLSDESEPPILDAPDQRLSQTGKGLQTSNEVEIPLEPIVSESGELSFPPPTGLPPAQRKSIETLQKYLIDLRDRYANTPLLIQSAHVNARRDRLTVELGDEWYELLTRRQDRLANELWKRSQQAGLPKLLLVDHEDTVLARSPMVGADVLILQRSPRIAPANLPVSSKSLE